MSALRDEVHPARYGEEWADVASLDLGSLDRSVC